MTGAAVVIGVGNTFRRDDGVGPAVADRIASLGLPGVRVLNCAAEPTAILDAWHGMTRAVLVDAVDAGADGHPGRVRTCTFDEVAESTSLSSHDLNLRQTYELGRALDRVPDSVTVVSIDIADAGHGSGLSPAVQTALPEAVRAVLAVLGGEREEPVDQQPQPANRVIEDG